MKPFDYSAVPYGFIHCLNAGCLQAPECLRHLAAQHIPAEVKSFTALNPAFCSTPEARCPHFKSAVPVCLARGISRLYDELPHRAAVDIKQELINTFSRSRYYRINRKELPVSPREQAIIARIFRKYGVTTEPQYDAFEEGYSW